MSSRIAMSGDRLRLYCDDQPRIESKCQLVPDTTYAVRLYSTRLTDNRYFDARAVKPSPQFLMVVHWASAHHATPMYALYRVPDSTQLQAGVLDLFGKHTHFNGIPYSDSNVQPAKHAVGVRVTA